MGFLISPVPWEEGEDVALLLLEHPEDAPASDFGDPAPWFPLEIVDADLVRPPRRR